MASLEWYDTQHNSIRGTLLLDLSSISIVQRSETCQGHHFEIQGIDRFQVRFSRLQC